jgi:hypothetical protein
VLGPVARFRTRRFLSTDFADYTDSTNHQGTKAPRATLIAKRAVPSAAAAGRDREANLRQSVPLTSKILRNVCAFMPALLQPPSLSRLGCLLPGPTAQCRQLLAGPGEGNTALWGAARQRFIALSPLAPVASPSRRRRGKARSLIDSYCLPATSSSPGLQFSATESNRGRPFPRRRAGRGLQRGSEVVLRHAAGALRATLLWKPPPGLAGERRRGVARCRFPGAVGALAGRRFFGCGRAKFTRRRRARPRCVHPWMMGSSWCLGALVVR